MIIRSLWIAALLGCCPAIACETAATDSSRIAVAGGSLTEILYFLGAQERIVATDTTSVYPREAQAFPSLGYVRNLSSEGILSLRPTLILGEHDVGPPEVLKQLAQTGTAITRIPETHTSAGIIAKISCVAKVLGIESVGEQQIAKQLQPILQKLETHEKRPPELRVAMLLGLRDGQPLAAGKDTSGHGFLAMIRVQNVFEDLAGWKPVSLEAMALANPDLILMPQRGASAAGGVHAIARHPAIRLTNAGRSKRIIAMDGMAMLGFGPRTLSAALKVADIARSVQTPRIINP